MTYPTFARLLYVFTIVAFLGGAFLLDYLGLWKYFALLLFSIFFLSAGARVKLLRCPICRESVGRSKTGYFAPWIGPNCRYCGSDLSKRHVVLRSPTA